MATKQSKTHGNKRQNKIQAILLADSFMTPHRFRPMTKTTPKVLLPVVNVPMLEYALEFLSTANVDEIIIFAASHADQIQTYINGTRWLHKEPELKVKIVISPDSRSVGDSLRYIDQLHIARQDFILLTGDVISNIDLQPIVLEHRAKSIANPELTVTMLFTTVQSNHAMRSRTDDLTIATDRSTGRILHYSDNIQQGMIDLPLKVLTDHGHNGINIQSNAFDTGILICNRRLLTVFADNFDYKDVRQDYIPQQLILDPDAAVPPDHIFSHVITKGAYATRIVDMRTYHTCSHDIIRRWVSPIVVSNNILGKTSYKSYPNNVYREDQVILAHTSLLKGDCVVGRKTKIGHSSLLHKTVVGRNVTIGDVTSLTTCYVFDNSTIGNNCVLNGAWIGKNVKIGNNVTIHKGAVIDDNVIIMDNVIVPPYVSITAQSQLDEEESIALTNEETRIQAISAQNKYIDLSQKYTQPPPSSSSSSSTTTPTTVNQLNTKELDILDHYPVDGRTFFYNNEDETQLAERIHSINSYNITTEGYDQDSTAIRFLSAFPRIMLPSPLILQLDSSPHQVFAKQTMSQIVHNNNNTNQNSNINSLDDDDLFITTTNHNKNKNNNHRPSTPMYSQRDTDQNFSPFTNKGYDALMYSKEKSSSSTTTQNVSFSQHSSDGFAMLSPSTLQQTLTNNSQEVQRALSQQLPYYSLSDLKTLHGMDTNLVVGNGGRGRLYLHPPHHKFGRAIVLLNSTAPPAYLTLQNYPLLTKSHVIAHTIDYGNDDYDDYNDYNDEDSNNEEDDYRDFDDHADSNNNTINDDEDEYSGNEDDGRGTFNNNNNNRRTYINTRETLMMSNDSMILTPSQLTIQQSGVMVCSSTLAGARTFINEVISTMKRCLTGEKVGDLLHELPTLRLTYRDVGFDVYLCAVVLGIFAMAQLPHPNRGLYKDFNNLPPSQQPWVNENAPDMKKSKLIVSKFFKLWSTTFKTDKEELALTSLFPAITTACLLHEQYSQLYMVLLNELYDSDYISEETLNIYYQRITPLTTLYTPAKSLLPSIVEYSGPIIVGMDKLTPILLSIINMLAEDDDEDEDDE